MATILLKDFEMGVTQTERHFKSNKQSLELPQAICLAAKNLFLKLYVRFDITEPDY